jgi:hypothetical protein
MICRCCGEDKPDVKQHPRHNALPAERAKLPYLCDACWDAPGLTYASCDHGRGKS